MPSGRFELSTSGSVMRANSSPQCARGGGETQSRFGRSSRRLNHGRQGDSRARRPRRPRGKASASVFQCFSVSVLQCFSVSVLQCFSMPVFQCFPAAFPPSHLPTFAPSHLPTFPLFQRFSVSAFQHLLSGFRFHPSSLPLPPSDSPMVGWSHSPSVFGLWSMVF